MTADWWLRQRMAVSIGFVKYISALLVMTGVRFLRARMDYARMEKSDPRPRDTARVVITVFMRMRFCFATIRLTRVKPFKGIFTVL